MCFVTVFSTISESLFSVLRWKWVIRGLIKVFFVLFFATFRFQLPSTNRCCVKEEEDDGKRRWEGGKGEHRRERGRGGMGERFKGTFSEACFFLALLGWKYIRLHAAVYKEAENGKNLQQEHTINSMLCSRTTTSLFWRNPIHNICVCMYGSHQHRLASTSKVKRLKTWPNFNCYLLKNASFA